VVCRYLVILVVGLVSILEEELGVEVWLLVMFLGVSRLGSEGWA